MVDSLSHEHYCASARRVVAPDYDSGMDEHQKREIRNLVHGVWDPRKTITPQLGEILNWLWRIYFVLVFLMLLDFISTFVIIGFFFVGVGCFILAKARAVPIARLCDRHHRELCLWCQYPLTDLEEQGQCPECGGGYRKDLCRELYRLAFNYDVGLNGVRQRIITHKWLWARAIRERDRGQG